MARFRSGISPSWDEFTVEMCEVSHLKSSVCLIIVYGRDIARHSGRLLGLLYSESHQRRIEVILGCTRLNLSSLSQCPGIDYGTTTGHENIPSGVRQVHERRSNLCQIRPRNLRSKAHLFT